MSRTRVFLPVAAVAAALASFGVHAQTDQSRYDVQVGLGLPAINIGASRDESHTPRSSEALRRAAMQSVFHAEGVSSSGARDARGRVIVKFRDEASQSARRDAIAAASPTAAMMARPSYANFDMLRIDMAEDAEATAQALASR